MRNNNINRFQKNTMLKLIGFHTFRKRLLKTNFISFNLLLNNDRFNVIEIGFGNGDNLIKMAVQYPKINFIGIELYKKGICNILKKIYFYKLKNITILYKNAYNILSKVKQNSIYGIHLLFPDPWIKTKHYKRRLINLQFISLLRNITLLGGFFHCATDIKQYSKLIYFNFSNYKYQFRKINIQYSSLVAKRTKFQRKNTTKKYYEILFTK